MSKRSSPLLDTRVIYCGDNLDQLPILPTGASTSSTSIIVALTVREILDEQIAMKLA